MERKGFLAGMLAFSTIPFLGFSFINHFTGKKGRGFKINANEGRYHGHLQLKGVNANIIDVKISGKDTDGALAIFEQTSLSQGRGTPLHVHLYQDEIFYVLEGEYLFQVGDEKYDLNVGDSIFLPREVPHAWTQRSAKGRMTVTLQPAGKLEDFFLALAALDHEPTKQEVDRIFAENEMKVLGPPMKLE